MKKPEYQPNFMHAILLLILYLFVFTLVPSLFFESLSRLLGFQTGDLLVAAAVTLIGFILLLFWVRRRWWFNYQGLFMIKQLKLKYLLPMLLMTAGAVIVLSEIQNLVFTFLPIKGDLARNILAIPVPGGTGFWKFVLYMGLVVPVVEEVIFRGLILRGFIKRYPAHRAIANSTLLSGFTHLNPWQLGLAHLNPWHFWNGVIWGSVSGWWFYKTRSLVPCIAGNALINLAPLLATDLLGLELPGLIKNFQAIQYQPLWFDMLGVGLLLAGILIFLKMANHRGINLIAD